MPTSSRRYRTTSASRTCPRRSTRRGPSPGTWTRPWSWPGQWCTGRSVDGLVVEVVQLEGRTPVLLLDVPATTPEAGAGDTVLLYGHLDKQPPMTDGWRPRARPVGAGPGRRPPVRAGRRRRRLRHLRLAGRHRGRAGVRRPGHARCVVLIECSEESGSPDLPAYVEHLAGRIGTPSLVVCLDSFCGDLRPAVGDDVAAGDADRPAPGRRADRGRALRQRRRRGPLVVPHPAPACSTASRTAPPDGSCCPSCGSRCPRDDGPRPRRSPPTGWATRPSRSSSGAAPHATPPRSSGCWPGRGSRASPPSAPPALPPSGEAGNVLRPWTELALSFRLPPTCPAEPAGGGADGRRSTPTRPHGAQCPLRRGRAERRAGTPRPPPRGWRRRWRRRRTPPSGPAGRGASGEGGTIPFMAMLGQRFPDAQFLVTGVLGPGLQRPRPQRVPGPGHGPQADGRHGPRPRRPRHPPLSSQTSGL